MHCHESTLRSCLQVAKNRLGTRGQRHLDRDMPRLQVPDCFVASLTSSSPRLWRLAFKLPVEHRYEMAMIYTPLAVKCTPSTTFQPCMLPLTLRMI